MIEIEPNGKPPNPWDEPTTLSRRQRARKIHRSEEEMIRFTEEPDQLGAALQASITRLERWFTVQYAQRTSTGMASSHAIYEQVLKSAVSHDQPKTPAQSLQKHIENLLKLSQESEVFETYGLSSLMNVDMIVKSLQDADDQQTPVLQLLLAPYIDTVEARFSELREIYQTIDTFVSQTNSFMAPKHVTYRVDEGVKVFSPQKQQLKPRELSSGERHLLLILSSAVLAGSNPTLIIIDEPEISLNTTWQRGLVDALLAVSKNTITQFLVASHSLALIANYSDHV